MENCESSGYLNPNERTTTPFFDCFIQLLTGETWPCAQWEVGGQVDERPPPPVVDDNASRNELINEEGGRCL